MIKLAETIILCCGTKIFNIGNFLKLVKYFQSDLTQALLSKANAKLLCNGYRLPARFLAGSCH